MKKQLIIAILMLTAYSHIGFAQDSLSTYRHSLFATPDANSLSIHAPEGLLTTQTRVIDESQMNNTNQVTNVMDAIRGRVAGLQVSGSGRYALSAVRLRGTTSLTGANDPLIIVDGVMGDLTLLQSVFPTDIESFVILKDASETAQFGSRGAAGVIDITTKRGQSGKMRINYNGTLGIAVPFKRLEMLDGDGYRSVAKQMGIEIIDLGHNTNFQKQIERTGLTHKHHLAFAGGGKHSSYRVSLGFIGEEEVIKGIGGKSFLGNINLSQDMWDDLLRIDFGMFASTQDDKDIEDVHKLFYSAAAWNPTFPTHVNSSGEWDSYPSASQINNPMTLLEKKNHSESDHVSTHAKFTFNLLPELKLVIFGSYSNTSNENRVYIPTSLLSGGKALRLTTRIQKYVSDITLMFNKKWNDHSLKSVLFTEFEKEKRRSYGVTVTRFSNDQGGYDALAAGAARPWDGTTSTYEYPRMLSFMGQLNYTFRNRYSVNATLRADGSSKFGDNNKWGYFPSVSVGWDLMQEQFFREMTFLDELKINAGLGWSGNQDAIDSYNALQLLEPNGIPSVGQTLITTYNELRNSNPDLKWEVSRTFNVGLSTQLFGSRLVFSASYYYTKVTDMLYPYSVSVPPFKYPKLLANLGSMEKSGLELSLGGTPLETRDMQLTINANLTFQGNRLLSLSGNLNGEELLAPSRSAISSIDGAGFHGPSSVVFQMIGEPLGVFFLPHCTGLTTYKNYDELRTYQTDGESYVAGQAMPKVLLGSNISFRYKNIDVTIQANGAFGHKIYNATSLTYMNLSSMPLYNVLAKAPQERIMTQDITDYWLENGNYLNIDYITIGWQVPIKKNPILESMRLSLTLNNVATITSYSGLTPMINSSSINGTLGLDDKRTYPLFRTWTMGVSLNF